MSQSDIPEKIAQPKQQKQQTDPLQPQDAPGDVPDIAGEYGIIGVDKDFWKDPFTEVEKDAKTGKQKRVL